MLDLLETYQFYNTLVLSQHLTYHHRKCARTPHKLASSISAQAKSDGVIAKEECLAEVVAIPITVTPACVELVGGMETV